MSTQADVSTVSDTIPDRHRVTRALERVTGRHVDIEDVGAVTEEELMFWSVYYLADGRARTLHNHALVPLGDDWNLDHVTTAVRSVLRRHPCLRSIFTIVDDRVVRAQLTMGEIARRCNLRSTKRTTPPDDDDISWLETDSCDHFDLRSEPPFRWGIIDQDGRPCLIAQAHHVAADGHGLSLLKAALITALADPEGQLRDDGPAPRVGTTTVPSPPLVRAGTDYWYETLRTAPTEPPPVRPHQHDEDSTGNLRVDFTISHQTRELMVRAAATHSATVAMLLMTYMSALLLRVTGTGDYIFASPFINRRSAAEWRKICNRATIVYPRVQVTGSTRVADALTSVRDTVLAAMRNGTYSAMDLRDRLNQDRFRELMRAQDGAPPHGCDRRAPGQADAVLQYLTQAAVATAPVPDHVDDTHTAPGPANKAKAGLIVLDSKSGIRGKAVLDPQYFSHDGATTFVRSLVALCQNAPSTLHETISGLDIPISDDLPRVRDDAEDTAAPAGSAPAGDQSTVDADSPTARAVCEILSAVCGQPVAVTDMFVGRGGSMRHIPAIVTGLLDRGLAVAPLSGLMELTPISTYVAAVDKAATS